MGDPLARIDYLVRGLLELRRELAERLPAAPSEGNGLDTGDDLLDTTSASARFGYPQDSIRRWCREEGIGVRSGGRWLVSVQRLRALNSGRKN
jgi:hypothetical protein